MSAKRALVVDDSKSARAFLAKLLEGHALEVDSAETAEQAIDYLTRHRPDVIFMDHLMPGMDGFQAVQAIKNNPRTATIPILMYTSQEGELYLGQARALGAMGVLPKSVAPADVSKVLQQLHLTHDAVPHASEPVGATLAGPDETTAEVPVALADTGRLHIATPSIQTPAMAAAATAAPPVVDHLLRDQIAELRRFMVSRLDDQSERLLTDVRLMIRDAVPPPPPPPAPVLLPPPPPAPRSPWPWALAAAASLVAVVLGALLWNQTQRLNSLEAGRAAAVALTATAPATGAVAKPVAAVGTQASLDASPEITVLPVPFGEAPLAGSRVDQLRSLVGALAANGLSGTVEVRRFAGRFCLQGDRGNGFSLADAAMPYLQCDLVADAGDAALGSQPAESTTFANTLAELRKAHGEAIRIQVAEESEGPAARSYPEIGGTPPRVPTAGEWNAAAEANNRVEIRWHPGT